MSNRRIAVIGAGMAGASVAYELAQHFKVTVLEQEASGAFSGLERELTRGAMSHTPAPFTRGALSERAAADPNEALDEREAATDFARVDALLTQRCVGEAYDGRLVETPSTCQGMIDVAEMHRLLERENRTRWQTWSYLQERLRRSTLDEVRRMWCRVHEKSVVCGSQQAPTSRIFRFSRPASSSRRIFLPSW